MTSLFPRNYGDQVCTTHIARRRDSPPEDGGAEGVCGGPLPLRESPLVGELGLGAVWRDVEKLVEGDEAVEGLFVHAGADVGVLTSVLAFGDLAVEAHLRGNYLQIYAVFKGIA